MGHMAYVLYMLTGLHIYADRGLDIGDRSIDSCGSVSIGERDIHDIIPHHVTGKQIFM